MSGIGLSFRRPPGPSCNLRAKRRKCSLQPAAPAHNVYPHNLAGTKGAEVRQANGADLPEVERHGARGAYRCAVCGFAVTLRDDDRPPRCPCCSGTRFETAPLFGQTTEIAAVDPGPTPDWVGRVRATLPRGDYLVFEQGRRVRTVVLADGWTRIGRSLLADVRIDDPTVSRRHALVHRDGTAVRLLDDRSLNGVFRNGRRVDLEPLSDGDTLSVGRFELHYVRGYAGSPLSPSRGPAQKASPTVTLPAISA